MPYSIRKDSSCPASKPYAVVKTSDGKVFGCHESEDKAQKQMTAIEINESASALREYLTSSE